MIQMNDNTIEIGTSIPSMRRTLLTLLGAVAAFGVLTASYATADLPAESAINGSAPQVMVGR
ncbi:hypothetical protein Sa4125_23170 [Aureimonas sp. SA4125]|nr:hypothetical protein Sa4125_23170 [Aureimonas sp. SA4125]